MSDLGVPGAATVACPRCGNQADASAAFCERCGAALTDPSAGADVEQLELAEAERAVAAAGFDTDAELVDGRGRCPVCSSLNDLSSLSGTGRAARDTPSDRDDLEVFGFHCGRCGAALRVVVDRDEAAGSGGTAGGYTQDRPVSTASFEDEVDRFEPSGPGSLRDQGDLIDDDGDDMRMYTGEPVETDEGWVVPMQQNFAGRDNIAGGGEWPDAHAEPAQPPPGTAGPSDGDGEQEPVVTPAEGEVDDAPEQDLPGRT